MKFELNEFGEGGKGGHNHGDSDDATHEPSNPNCTNPGYVGRKTAIKREFQLEQSKVWGTKLRAGE